MGVIVVLIILLSEWSQGKLLKNDEMVPMLAMIYIVFYAVNMISFFGIIAYMGFAAVMERLSVVFAMEEKKMNRDTLVPSEFVEVTAKNASFTWGFKVKEDQSEAKLGKVDIVEDDSTVINGIDFSLRSGDLMVVVGMVGCGKTTLLNSIMEETKLKSGELTIKGTVAYVEQEPFIYSGTIKENILIGKVYDDKLFQHALQASQLIKDVENLKKGADTIIGERGINVSGG